MGLAGLLIAALGTVTYFGVLVWGQDNFPYTPTTALEFLYGRMAAQLVLMGILPVYCLFVAITNDRVWQVESIFSRALLYSALSFSVIALYVILVSVLSSLFHVESGNLVTSLLATGAVALVFDAIRERIQRVIKRSMFGRRDDLSGVLDALGKQIEVAASPDSVLHAVVQTIGKELRLPYVAVELHATSVSKRQTAPLGIVSFGVPTTPNHRERFPLIVQGKTVGVLIIALRDGQPGLAPADMDVLHALATQIGSLVQALQLTADLQESRQRLVAAREEERRRLRRDLHDSVGPMLAALSMQTETARELIATQPQRSEALLGDVLLQLQAILGDIRRVVYGLRPPALDDLGLASALRTQSAMFGQGKVVLRVMIEEPLPPLSAATEVAIYCIVQEALTNVMRHADARNAEVRMSIDTAQSLVVLEITDDGKGIAADSRSGVGLHSMHERAAELNGTCTIHSTLGEGTKIKIVLPW
jgi:signal transduction histidine kinase